MRRARSSRSRAAEYSLRRRCRYAVRGASQGCRDAKRSPHVVVCGRLLEIAHADFKLRRGAFGGDHAGHRRRGTGIRGGLGFKIGEQVEINRAVVHGGIHGVRRLLWAPRSEARWADWRRGPEAFRPSNPASRRPARRDRQWKQAGSGILPGFRTHLAVFLDHVRGRDFPAVFEINRVGGRNPGEHAGKAQDGEQPKGMRRGIPHGPILSSRWLRPPPHLAG